MNYPHCLIVDVTCFSTIVTAALVLPQQVKCLIVISDGNTVCSNNISENKCPGEMINKH